MALTQLTASMAIIAALSDLPNATDGLTAAQLKAKFDEASGLIKTYLNSTLTVELDAILALKQPLEATLTALSAFNTNGLMKQTALDTFTAVTAPTGAVVGTTDTQTLTNKSISGDQVNSGTVPVARIPTAIPATSIGNGDVDNTELSCLNNVTSSIQTQFSNKQPLDTTLTALAAFNTNGLLKQTSADTFTAVTAPSGAVVGDSDTQTLTNKTLTSPSITSPTESTTLSAITVDLTVIGEWAVATMAASCSFGEVLFMSSSGYNKAKADADSTLPSVGLCIETGTGARKVLKKGYVKNNAWSWTAGQLLYVSTATAGAITSTLPAVVGNRVQIIGYAEAATIIYFNPDYTFVQV